VLRVVPLAPRPVFRPDLPEGAIADARARHGLDHEYLVYPGRYDARHDLPTLLRALALVRGGSAAGTVTPRLLLVGTSPDERAALARIAIREGVGESLSYAPLDDEAEVAALVAGARAAVLPVLSDANGHPALEAIAAGTPVVASAIGALPEVVGGAGILVEPESPERLAAGLQALLGSSRARSTVDAAIRAARAHRRTWDEVAVATRAIYAEAAATAV
jgi:glycosyltransferase involved in cell wall biosynthesis